MNIAAKLTHSMRKCLTVSGNWQAKHTSWSSRSGTHDGVASHNASDFGLRSRTKDISFCGSALRSQSSIRLKSWTASRENLVSVHMQF